MEEVASNPSISIVVDISLRRDQFTIILHHEALARMLLLSSKTGMQRILILFLNSIIHGQVYHDVNMCLAALVQQAWAEIADPLVDDRWRGSHLCIAKCELLFLPTFF